MISEGEPKDEENLVSSDDYEEAEVEIVSEDKEDKEMTADEIFGGSETDTDNLEEDEEREVELDVKVEEERESVDDEETEQTDKEEVSSKKDKDISQKSFFDTFDEN